MLIGQQHQQWQHEVWLPKEEEEDSERIRMILLDALEIKVEKDPDIEDHDKVEELTWDVLEYDKDTIKLQIDFESPGEVGIYQAKDYISVTFWGVSLFKSSQDIEVQFGKKLTLSIQRQLDPEATQYIDPMHYLLNSVLLISLFVLLAFMGLSHVMVSAWMFLNSIQLILHVPLLSLPIPANLHYFLVYYLDLARLQLAFLKQLQFFQNHIQPSPIVGQQSPDRNVSTLEYCHYEPNSLISNLAMILLVIAAIFTMIIFLQILDFIYCRKGRRRLAPRLFNIGIRFLYCFFFEISICVMIHFSQAQGSRSIERIASWACACLIALFSLFIMALAFRGGPYVKSTYQRGSLKSSFWGRRKLLAGSMSTQILTDEDTETVNLKEVNCVDRKGSIDNNMHTERHLLSLQDQQPMQQMNLSFRKQDMYEGGSTEETALASTPALKREARLRVSLQEQSKVSMAYETLFLGLKRNHEHNAAVVQLNCFTLRRILYAFLIVHVTSMDQVFFSAFALSVTCILMMILICMEAQWEDQLINRQHLFNEVVFYTLCVNLMCFSGVITDSGLANDVGYTMILMTVGLVLGNVTFVLYDLYKFVKLLRRRYGQYRGTREMVKDVKKKGKENKAVLISKKRNLIIPTSDISSFFLKSKPVSRKKKVAVDQNQIQNKKDNELLSGPDFYVIKSTRNVGIVNLQAPLQKKVQEINKKSKMKSTQDQAEIKIIAPPETIHEASSEEQDESSMVSCIESLNSEMERSCVRQTSGPMTLNTAAQPKLITTMVRNNAIAITETITPESLELEAEAPEAVEEKADLNQNDQSHVAIKLAESGAETPATKPHTKDLTNQQKKCFNFEDFEQFSSSGQPSTLKKVNNIEILSTPADTVRDEQIARETDECAPQLQDNQVMRYPTELEPVDQVAADQTDSQKEVIPINEADLDIEQDASVSNEEMKLAMLQQPEEPDSSEPAHAAEVPEITLSEALSCCQNPTPLKLPSSDPLTLEHQLMRPIAQASPLADAEILAIRKEMTKELETSFIEVIEVLNPFHHEEQDVERLEAENSENDTEDQEEALCNQEAAQQDQQQTDIDQTSDDDLNALALNLAEESCSQIEMIGQEPKDVSQLQSQQVVLGSQQQEAQCSDSSDQSPDKTAMDPLSQYEEQAQTVRTESKVESKPSQTTSSQFANFGIVEQVPIQEIIEKKPSQTAQAHFISKDLEQTGNLEYMEAQLSKTQRDLKGDPTSQLGSQEQSSDMQPGKTISSQFRNDELKINVEPLQVEQHKPSAPNPAVSTEQQIQQLEDDLKLFESNHSSQEPSQEKTSIDCQAVIEHESVENELERVSDEDSVRPEAKQGNDTLDKDQLKSRNPKLISEESSPLNFIERLVLKGPSRVIEEEEGQDQSPEQQQQLGNPRKISSQKKLPQALSGVTSSGINLTHQSPNMPQRDAASQLLSRSNSTPWADNTGTIKTLDQIQNVSGFSQREAERNTSTLRQKYPVSISQAGDRDPQQPNAAKEFPIFLQPLQSPQIAQEINQVNMPSDSGLMTKTMSAINPTEQRSNSSTGCIDKVPIFLQSGNGLQTLREKNSNLQPSLLCKQVQSINARRRSNGIRGSTKENLDSGALETPVEQIRKKVQDAAYRRLQSQSNLNQNVHLKHQGMHNKYSNLIPQVQQPTHVIKEDNSMIDAASQSILSLKGPQVGNVTMMRPPLTTERRQMKHLLSDSFRSELGVKTQNRLKLIKEKIMAPSAGQNSNDSIDAILPGGENGNLAVNWQVLLKQTNVEQKAPSELAIQDRKMQEFFGINDRVSEAEKSSTNFQRLLRGGTNARSQSMNLSNMGELPGRMGKLTSMPSIQSSELGSGGMGRVPNRDNFVTMSPEQNMESLPQSRRFMNNNGIKEREKNLLRRALSKESIGNSRGKISIRSNSLISNGLNILQ